MQTRDSMTILLPLHHSWYLNCLNSCERLNKLFFKINFCPPLPKSVDTYVQYAVTE